MIQLDNNEFYCTICGIKTDDYYKSLNCTKTFQCRSCFKEKRRTKYWEDPVKEKNTTLKWKKENKTKQYRYVAKWYKNNRRAAQQTQTRYMKKRRHNDPIYKLSNNIRGRLRRFLKQKNIIKKYKLTQYLGCNLGELKVHLEKQFKDGMTWDTYGKWHIDHIIPLVSAKTEEEMYNLCHYTNLQPLWASENISKGAKF